MPAFRSPLAALFPEGSITHTGMTATSLSLVAMAVNYLYNLFFDPVLVRLGFSLRRRSGRLRAIHALLFELVLLVSVPIVAVSLQLSLAQALVTDMGFAVFALVYAYVFNRAYNWLFPVPVTAP